MAKDFRLPLSGVSTHKSVNPQKLTLTNTSSGSVEYDGSAAKSVDLAALTVNRASVANNGVFFVKGTQTAATNAWTGNLPQVNSLYDGLTIAYYLPFNGTGTAATLLLTLAGNVATAAEPVYYAADTRATTHYAAHSIVHMTWISNTTSGLAAVGSATGRWERCQYNSDDNYYQRLNNFYGVTGANYGFMTNSLFMETSDGKFESLTTTGGISSASSQKVPNTTAKFKPYKVFYWATSALAKNSNIGSGSVYQQYCFDTRYSTNIYENSTAGGALQVRKPFYIVGTLDANGFLTLANPWYTQEPVDEEKVYIYIGTAYNWYCVDMFILNPLYGFVNHLFVEISTYALKSTSANSASYDGENNLIHSTYIKKVTSTDNAIVRFNGTSGAVLNSGITINDSNLLYSPNSIYITKTGECGVEVDATGATNPNKVAFIVGSSGNGGIYSRQHSKWIVYADKNGTVVLNGNANTATSATTATKLAAALLLITNLGSTSNGSFIGNSNGSTALEIGIKGTLTYDHGGTGFTSYTKGDLIYASANNTLAKRAIGTAGYLLASVDGVPNWKKPSDITVGAASSAATLTTAQTISISGAVSGSASGGANNSGWSISTSYNSTVPINKGGTNITTYAKGDLLYASAANTLSKLAIGTANYLLAVTNGLPAWKKPDDIIVGIATKLGSSTVGSKTIPIWLENGLPKVTEMDYAGENMIPTAYLGTQGNGVTDVYDRFTATHTLTVSSESTAADTAYLGLAILNNKVLIPWGHYFTLTCEIWSPVDAIFGYDENTALETAASGYTGNDFYTNHTGSGISIPANTWTKVWYQHANLRTPTSTAGANLLPDKRGIYEYSYFGIKAASGNLKGKTFKIRYVLGFLGTNPNTEYHAAPEDGGRNGFLVLQGSTSATVAYLNNTRPQNPAIYFKNAAGNLNISLTFSDYDSVAAPASLTLAGNQGNEWFIAPKIKATAGFTGTLTGSATSLSCGAKGGQNQPVYFTGDGIPAACTYSLKATLNNATQWGVAYYSTTTNVTSTAAGTSGYLLLANGSAAPTWINATNANTASTIVKRDASGNFSAGTITATLNGNATGFISAKTITLTGDTTGSGNGGNSGNGWSITTTTKYLSATSVNTEEDIGKSKTAVYTGGGGSWTGTVSNMAYAAILHVGGDYSRSWEIWARRFNSDANGVATDGIHWRPANNDATAWSADRMLLDTANYTNYTVTKTGGGASGTQWAISITGNAASATTAGKWSSARTLTIGNKGQSVDGSTNVSWALLDVLIRGGNEFNYTADGISSLWFNYKTQTGTSATTQIKSYNFGNGQMGTTGVTVYAATFNGALTGNVTGNVTGNATTSNGFAAAKTITLTGDTTGSGNGGTTSAGWSITTSTKYVTFLGRRNANADAMNYNPNAENSCNKMSICIMDGTSRSKSADNSPSFDAGVINLPWDWGGYNGQIALGNTGTARMQIRSAGHTDNGENANPRYTSNYGVWREVVTATKATLMGNATKPVYISNTGQVTECTAYSSATVSAADHLTSSAGTVYNPIYFSNGKPTASKISFKHYLNGTEKTTENFEFVRRDFTKSITFNGDWQDLGIAGTDLESGTWIVQLYDDTRTSGAQVRYLTYWSGVMSWYSDGTNGGGQTEEIILHAAGHALNSNHYHLRTIYPNQTATAKLLIKCSTAAAKSAANNLTLKFFKVL